MDEYNNVYTNSILNSKMLYFRGPMHPIGILKIKLPCLRVEAGPIRWDDLSVSYGIATNYLEWCFLNDEADKVTEEMLTVSLEDGRPTIESLRTIANKIIAILE